MTRREFPKPVRREAFRRSNRICECHRVPSLPTYGLGCGRPLGAGMSRAPAPWRTVPSLENRCAIFDAENGFVTLPRSDIAHRVVEAINEVEGRIQT